MKRLRRRAGRVLAGYIVSGVALTIYRVAAFTASGERRLRPSAMSPRAQQQEVKPT